MQASLPTQLITGLLGSGKTTCLAQLIPQKPAEENWLILVNEFGEVDIDAHFLECQTQQNSTITIKAVAGGCICCTAQISLINTLNQALQQEVKYDRIFIEPTGLGHPAKIIDAIKHTPFAKPLTLQKVVCCITPQQLTKARWQKSAVMRDLVTLADCILLNKCDLTSVAEQTAAIEILQNCYPPKGEYHLTQHSKIALADILGRPTSKPFVILSSSETELHSEHQTQLSALQTSFKSSIKGVISSVKSETLTDNGSSLSSTGWTWQADVQFNRNKLKVFFDEIAPCLLRAKGLLKTGNEWQLIQWSDQQLSFQDVAWREDNRLEILFNNHANSTFTLDSESIEKSLQQTIYQRE